MVDSVEIAQEIESMEAEMRTTSEVRQRALQQAQEAEAMLQRQNGYILALRNMQEKINPTESSANGSVPEPEEVEA
jgi:hypothetical protein|tara:strand:- start:9 stop:236 length:228 start_codon:yes stop_codon:yes gene_type:complete